MYVNQATGNWLTEAGFNEFYNMRHRALKRKFSKEDGDFER